jgi:phosphoribosylaminoimidazole carboxylase (NCAIR synthetase)
MNNITGEINMVTNQDLKSKHPSTPIKVESETVDPVVVAEKRIEVEQLTKQLKASLAEYYKINTKKEVYDAIININAIREL